MRIQRTRPSARDAAEPPERSYVTEEDDTHITATPGDLYEQVSPPGDQTVKRLKGDRGHDTDAVPNYRISTHAQSSHARNKNGRNRKDLDVDIYKKELLNVPQKHGEHLKLENEEVYYEEDNGEEDADEDEEGEDIWMDRMQADFGSSRGGSRSNTKGGRKKMGKKLGGGSNFRHNMEGFSYEYRIKQKLLMHYDKDTRPVRNDSTETTVYIGMSLYHILDTVRNVN